MQPIRSIDHFFSSRVIVIAPVGHFLEQIPQKIQSSISISIRPRVFSFHSLGITGYMSVAGFFLRLRMIIFPIFKYAIRLTYLSVQLIQGSTVTTSTGTSARSQPCSVLTNAGMFALVGVRTRMRSRNF